MKRYLPYMFLCLIFVGVGFTSITHVPFDSFDETNTIRIISESFPNIVTILNHESNYPIYYFILKLAYWLLGNNAVLLQVVYFGSYLISCYLFYRIIGNFTENHAKKLVAIAAFGIIPSLVYHASYIRMYNLAITLSLAVILLLIEFSHKKESKYLYMAAGLLAFVITLHPIGIIATLLYIPLLISKDLTKKQRIMVAIFFIIGVTAYVGQLIGKQHAVETYATNGAKYIEALNYTVASTGLFFQFAATVLKPRNANYLIAFPLFVSVVVDTALILWLRFKTKNQLLLDTVAVTAFAIYFIVPMLFGTKIFLHHLHFHLAFGVFSVVYALFTDKIVIASEKYNIARAIVTLSLVIASLVLVRYSNAVILSFNATIENQPSVMLAMGSVLAVVYIFLPKLKYLITIIISVLFLSFHFTYNYYIPLVVNKARCEYFQAQYKNDNMYFFSQHFDANLLFNCLQTTNNIVLMDEHRDLIVASDHTRLEVLIEQAKRGGSFASISELQQLFDESESLLESKSINNVSLWIRGISLTCPAVESPSIKIKGFEFLGCGRYDEYLYTRSQ